MPLSARPSTKAFALLLASLGATFASGCTSFARVSAGPTLMPATKAEPVSAGVGVMAQRGFGAPDGRRSRRVFVRFEGAQHKKMTTRGKASWHALGIRELFGPSIPDGLANREVQWRAAGVRRREVPGDP